MSGTAQNGKLTRFNMNKIHLNGANPDKIAELIGGTLIMHDTTNDIASIAGGDIEKLRRYELKQMDASNHLPQYNSETDGDYMDWAVANNVD